MKLCLIFSVNLRSCPNDWIDAGQIGCYYIPKRGPALAWHEANSFCKQFVLGAGLAEIHDGMAYNFLKGSVIIRHDYWLGGNDHKKVKTMNDCAIKTK